MKKSIKKVLSFLAGIAATTLPVISLAGSCGASSNTSDKIDNSSEKENNSEKENGNEKENSDEKENSNEKENNDKKESSDSVLTELNYTNNSEEEFKKLEYSKPVTFDETIINKLGMVLTNVQKKYLSNHDVKIQKNAGEKKVTFYYTDDDNKNLNGTVEFKYFLTSCVNWRINKTFDLMSKYLVVSIPKDDFINAEYNNEIIKNSENSFLSNSFSVDSDYHRLPYQWYSKDTWDLLETKKDSLLTFSKKKGENSLSCRLEFPIKKNKVIVAKYTWNNLGFPFDILGLKLKNEFFSVIKYFSFTYFKESIKTYSEFFNNEFSHNYDSNGTLVYDAALDDVNNITKNEYDWPGGNWMTLFNKQTVGQLNYLKEIQSKIDLMEIHAAKWAKSKFAFWKVDFLPKGNDPVETLTMSTKPAMFKIDLNEAKAKDWTKEGIDFIYGDNPERNLKWGDEFTLIRTKPAGQDNYSYYVVLDFDKDKIKVRSIEDQKIHYIVTDKQVGTNKENKIGISKTESYTDGNYTDYDSLDEVQFFFVG